MIQNIRIHKIGTYTNPVSISPRRINFCYGSNGSGKTTLSNIIGQESFSVDSSVTWGNGKKLPVLVYNKKFVEDNFAENQTLNGVFTLGQESKGAQEFIDEQRKEAHNCANLVENHSRSKENLVTEVNQLISDFEETCWGVQQKYGAKFSKALIGYRGTKKVFSNKCLQEYSNMDEEHPPVLSDIEHLYDIAFSRERETYPFYKEIDITNLSGNEECSLLSKRISGSAETPIGKFIEFLQNSDWVKQGNIYVEKSDGKCPYCQQMLPSNIQQDIEAFFDDDYKKACSLVRNFESQYETYTKILLSGLENILTNPITIIDYTLFKSEVEVLSSIINSNKKIIQNKIFSPATEVSIDSIILVIKGINAIIASYNEEIKINNDIVQNQSSEKERCKKLLWQYFSYELRTGIQQYQKNYEGKMCGIESLNTKIKEQSEKEAEYKRLIAEKEETLTSVLPTVNAINGILKRFGFDGFELAENPSEKATYKIIRPDGSNAKKTLSEGEYNFITFLYFYHLVYGSKDKTDIATDKVVVIDDPISSLDSNTLFIISTLVRTLLNDCMNEDKGIKQIFILTHNVYFHKEVSFLGSRNKYPTNITAYWIIKKTNNVTDVVFYQENPIQTSYELLWADLKNVDNHQRITVFNTLRRILEYYFNIIGGMDYEKCIDQFDGEDKIICKALISSINDGSHFISDDFVMCYESNTMENYLRVFKLIFERMDHGSHYRMMMGEAESNLLEAAATLAN